MVSVENLLAQSTDLCWCRALNRLVFLENTQRHEHQGVSAETTCGSVTNATLSCPMLQNANKGPQCWALLAKHSDKSSVVQAFCVIDRHVAENIPVSV